MSTPSAAQPRFSHTRLLALLALAFVVLAGSAMLRTSTTFDEIVFSAVGARGIRLGDFTFVNDHPRLAQYMFGLPVYLSIDNYPSEAGNWNWLSRYHYARALIWGVGNNSEQVVMVARLVGLAFGTLTVLATYFLSRRHLGAGAALFAAALAAFLPDVLAHSGVAYNDIPLAFGVLVSVYALDNAVRNPAPARVALAALACALTVCIKYSGLIVGPVLIGLLLLEALSGRWRDREWRRAIALALPVFMLVGYATIVLIYLGDWRLADFFSGMREIAHVSSAGRVAFLMGERNVGGWWYFFPVALALKTPLALHVLMLLAVVGAWAAARGGRWREWLVHPARAPALGAVLFLGAVLGSGINIGSRHALPALPLVCILVAQGIAPIWDRGRTATRGALAVVFASYLLSTLSHYPYFLSYLSEYARGRALHETLVDSSTDWGQGLVALRAYMREHNIDQVALAYFGSALPEGYGIRYVALPSFLDLPPQAASPAAPRYAVISATLLSGTYAGYLRGDLYAALRRAKPVAVVAETLYVYDLEALGKL
jgi:4-amino-4-deoxy-L-arabinose transferase-like glycosyltransferase